MTQKNKLIGVDFENAEQLLTRPAVNNRPLLPLHEAIYNALHASQENENQHIDINIKIYRNTEGLTQELSPITGFCVTDYGIGFTNRKIESFFKLFTQDKKEKFNSKGIGRLTYFSAFQDVHIDSIYMENKKFFRRNISLTLKSLGTDDIPRGREIKADRKITKVIIDGLKPEVQHKYNFTPEYIYENILEEFAPAILTLQNFTILLSDGNFKGKIDIDSFEDKNIKSFIVENNLFKIYFIKDRQSKNKRHELIYAAAGRQVKKENIDFLPTTKLDVPSFGTCYLRGIIISEYLDNHVNTTRTDFTNIPEKSEGDNIISFETIRNNSLNLIKEYIFNIIPSSKHANDTTLEKITDNLPHLAAVANMPQIIAGLPLYCSEEKARDTLAEAYAKQQVEAINYVKRIEEKYCSQDFLDHDEFIRDIKEKLQDGMQLNHAQLITYVLYRDSVINLFAQLLKKKENGKYPVEATIHNLIFKQKSSSDNCKKDYLKHNLWLIDDRYSTYQYLNSDTRTGKIAGTKSSPSDSRYDLIAIYKDPISNMAQNILLVELKKSDIALCATNDPVMQLQDYVREIRNGKINTFDGQKININDSTCFQGLILCDTNHHYFKNMIDYHTLCLRPDGRSYFTIKNNLFLEVMNYNEFIEIAKSRNSAFITALKGQMQW